MLSGLVHRRLENKHAKHKQQLENKLDLIPITIVDNFFKDPDYIRSEALKLNYGEIKSKSPGMRAICPPNIAEIVTKKIFALLVDMNKHIIEGKLDLYFQLTTKELEHGWVHSDANGRFYFAGVIYLTPNAPLSGGTSIYRSITLEPNLDLMEELQAIKTDFYLGKSNDLQKFKENKKQNNSLFHKTVDISNIYNRLVMYPVNEFHSENILFGETKEDARLTLVFFVSHIASNTALPIDRMNLVEK